MSNVTQEDEAAGRATGTADGAHPGTADGAHPGTADGAHPGTADGAQPGTAGPAGTGSRGPHRRFGVVRHSLALAGRSIRRIRRSPEQLLDVTLQPVMFLGLFVYLFGGAVSGSRQEYLQLLLPAIMVQTVLFTSMALGVNLNNDIKKGVFDRFRSLPISRAAPLVGAVLGEVVRFSVSITVVMITGYLMGFRVHTDPLRALAACLLVLLFSLSVSWSAVLLGLVVREPGVVQGIGFLLLFPLTFGSSTYVPVKTLPDWLQSWVHINPVTHLIDASRALMLGGPAASAVWQSLLWCVIFVGVFAPLAVRAYRRRT